MNASPPTVNAEDAGLRADVSLDRKTTFVLLHGSWGGGWIWDDVRPSMEAAGATVFTPSLSMYPDGGAFKPEVHIDHESHVQEVLALFTDHDLNDVVLAGHSYGALVATVVAAQVPERMRCLVLLDGFLSQQGLAIFDMHPEVAGLMGALVEQTRPWQVPAPPGVALGLPEGQASKRHDRLARPMPWATHANPVKQDFTALSSLPRHYLRCKGFPMFEATCNAAKEQGWQCSEIQSGHFPMLTAPLVLASRLMAIASHPGQGHPFPISEEN